MGKLVWDKTSERYYETGVKNGVLYVVDGTGTYGKGVAWNGITKVTESPSGADATPLYADNIKYLNLISAEEFGCTIEAYTYPDEFAACDGSSELATGISIGQQSRRSFGFCYRTESGNDTLGTDYGYKIHIVYGATASPTSKDYQTINDSPEAISLSWEVKTTPVEVTTEIDGKKPKPTATLVIDSTKVNSTKLKAIEDQLYGTTDTEPTLLLPDEVVALLA